MIYNEIEYISNPEIINIPKYHKKSQIIPSYIKAIWWYIKNFFKK